MNEEQIISNSQTTNKKFMLFIVAVSILMSSIFGVAGGVVGYRLAEEDQPITSNVLKQDVKVIDEESAVITVAKQSSNSVVSILATSDNNQSSIFGEAFQSQSAGTGFIVSEDGMIVTNRHVVDTENATYTIFFNDGDEATAEVIARDTLFDIAFLKVNTDKDLVALELGSSEDLKVGQKVVAIGNALGEFSNSVSTGIVSGLSRNILAGDGNGFSERLDDVIQTDASINPGNSGGPLLDINGNVIGVNVAIAQDAENIGFAIPIDYVRDLIERLDETGNIDRPLLGIRFRDVNGIIAEELNLDFAYGALIVPSSDPNEPSIVTDSPAEKAGLQEGDVILEIDGVKVNNENPLVNLVQTRNKGDELILIIWRDGETFEVEAEL